MSHERIKKTAAHWRMTRKPRSLQRAWNAPDSYHFYPKKATKIIKQATRAVFFHQPKKRTRVDRSNRSCSHALNALELYERRRYLRIRGADRLSTKNTVKLANAASYHHCSVGTHFEQYEHIYSYITITYKKSPSAGRRHAHTIIDFRLKCCSEKARRNIFLFNASLIHQSARRRPTSPRATGLC